MFIKQKEIDLIMIFTYPNPSWGTIKKVMITKSFLKDKTTIKIDYKNKGEEDTIWLRGKHFLPPYRRIEYFCTVLEHEVIDYKIKDDEGNIILSFSKKGRSLFGILS